MWLRRAGALLVLGTGLLAAWYLVFPLAPEIRPYEPGARRVDPQVGRTIEWWRTHGYANELIYAQQNIAEELAIFGGLSVVGEDYDLTTMGIADAVLEERQALAAAVRGTMSLEALHGLGVTWIMLSDQEIENLGPRAQAVLADPAGPLVLTATIPAAPPSPRRRIWRVPGEVSSPRQDRLTPRR